MGVAFAASVAVTLDSVRFAYLLRKRISAAANPSERACNVIAPASPFFVRTITSTSPL
jgi:hypothetical protein